VVIHVVNAIFLSGLTEKPNPASAVAARLSSVSPLSNPDTATAHTKLVRFKVFPFCGRLQFVMLFDP
jgi:hypothetical protein